MAAAGRKKPNGVDERLTQLEEDVVRLDGELKSVKHALDKERGERIEADNFAQATIADEVAKVRKLVEKTSVGAFNEEIVGLVWLVFSALCTTLSAELAVYC